MSVRVPDRDTARTEFIYTAREIYKYTMQMAINDTSKRQNDYIGKPLVERAERIHDEAVFGNSIYPTIVEEMDMKIKHFLLARANAYVLISKLSLLEEVTQIPNNKIIHISELVDSEIKLLSGVIKSTREQKKKLFPD